MSPPSLVLPCQWRTISTAAANGGPGTPCLVHTCAHFEAPSFARLCPADAALEAVDSESFGSGRRCTPVDSENENAATDSGLDELPERIEGAVHGCAHVRSFCTHVCDLAVARPRRWLGECESLAEVCATDPPRAADRLYLPAILSQRWFEAELLARTGGKIDAPPGEWLSS